MATCTWRRNLIYSYAQPDTTRKKQKAPLHFPARVISVKDASRAKWTLTKAYMPLIKAVVGSVAFEGVYVQPRDSGRHAISGCKTFFFKLPATLGAPVSQFPELLGRVHTRCRPHGKQNWAREIRALSNLEGVFLGSMLWGIDF